MKRIYNLLALLVLFALVGTAGLQDAFAAAPTTQAKSLSFSNITTGGAKISWINGNGTGRLVVVFPNSTAVGDIDAAVTNGTTYTGNTTFGNGASQIGATTGYAVYRGTGSTRTVTVTGLAAGTTYNVKVYEYKNDGGTDPEFNTSAGASNNPRTFTTVASVAPPTALTNGSATSTSIAFSYTAAAGAEGYYLDVDEDDDDFANPLDDYTDLDIGNVLSFEVVGLVTNTSYNYRLRAYIGNITSTNSAEGTMSTLDDDTPPTVTTITVNGDQPITEASATETFSVTVNFNEAMNHNVAPVITFNANVITTLTSGSGYWEDEDTYTINYTIADVNEYANGVDVIVGTAQDVAGNEMVSNNVTGADEFSIDMLAPTAPTPSLAAVGSGSGYEAFYNSTSTGTSTSFILPLDASLDGGSYTLQIFDDANDEWINVTAPDYEEVEIVGTPNGSESTSRPLTNAELEAINGAAQTGGLVGSDNDNNIIRVRLVLVDAVGNTTTSTQSAAITVDETGIAAPTPTLTSTGTGAFTGFYNASATGLNLAFTVPSEVGGIYFPEVAQSTIGLGFPLLPGSKTIIADIEMGNPGNDEAGEAANYVVADADLTTAGFVNNDGSDDPSSLIARIVTRDASGNYTNGSYSGLVAIEETRPTVTITRNTITDGTNFRTKDNLVSYDIAYSKAITGFAIADITVNDPGDATFDVVEAGDLVEDNAGTDYTFTITNVAGDGTLGITLESTGFTDAAGNELSEDAVSLLFTIDNTLPTVTSILRKTPSGQYTNATEVVYEVTFSESVTDVQTTDFAATEVSGDVGTPAVSAVSAASGTVIDVTINSISLNGTLRLDFTGLVTDLASNVHNDDNVTNGETYIIDNIAPTVTSINRLTPAGEFTTADQVIYRVTFSESVTGVATGDFTVTKTLTADGAVSAVSAASGSTIDVTVNTVTGDGTLRLDLNDASVTDQAGNAFSGPYTSGQTYDIDNTLPVAPDITTLSSAGGTVVSGYFNGTNTGITLTFTLPNDISLTGAGSYTVEYSTDNGSTWYNLETPDYYANAAIEADGDDGDGNVAEIGKLQTITLSEAELVNLFNSHGGTYEEGDYINFRTYVQDRVFQYPAGSARGAQGASNIVFDQVAPTQVASPVLATTGSPVVSGYYNASNDGVTLAFTVPNEVGGAYQIQVFDDSDDSWDNLGSAVTIITATGATANNEAGDAASVVITDGALTSYVTAARNGNSLKFRVNTTDLAGNSTTGTNESNAVTVDETAPSQVATPVLATTGAPVVSGYYNASNDGVTLAFTVPNEVDGAYQIQVFDDSDDSWDNIGSAVTIITATGALANNEAGDAASVVITDGDLTAYVTSARNGNSLKFRVNTTDVAGNSTTGTNESNAVTVDETAPSQVATPVLATTGAPVVSGYYNASNDGVTLAFTVSNEVDGAYQIQVFDDSDDSWDNLGSAVTIITATGALANNEAGDAASVVITDGDLTAYVTSARNGNSLKFRVNTTDVAGNLTTGTNESNAVTVDETLPTISSIVRTAAATQLTKATTVSYTATFSECMNDGTITLDPADFAISTGTIASVTMSNCSTYVVVCSTAVSTYTSTLSATGVITDVAGNALAVPTNGSSNETYLVDREAPNAVSDVTYTLNDGTDTPGYFNASNSEVLISFTVPNEVGGKYYLEVFDEDEVYAVGQWKAINTAVDIIAGTGALANNEAGDMATFTKSTDFANIYGIGTDGNELKFRVNVVDAAENSTNGTPSAARIIDRTAPTAAGIASLTAVAGTVVSGYYNASNTDGVTLTFTIPNDATLVGGTYTVQYTLDGTSFTDLTTPDYTGNAIIANNATEDGNVGEIGTIQTISLSEAQLDAMDGGAIDDGDLINFRVVLTDIAGNGSGNGAEGTDILVDQTVPTISGVAFTPSSGLRGVGQTVVATATLTGNEANGTIGTLTINGVTASGAALTFNNPNTTFTATYTVVEGNTDIADAAALPFTIGFTDAAGNSATAFTNVTLADAGLTPGIDANTPVLADNGFYIPGDVDGTPDAAGYNTLVPRIGTGGYAGTTDSKKIYGVTDATSDDNVYFRVRVASDASLEGGTIQMQAQNNTAGTWANLGSAHTIVNGNLNNTVDMTVSEIQLAGLFAQTQFRAVITDAAGNSLNTNTAHFGDYASTPVNYLTYSVVAPTLTYASTTASGCLVKGNTFTVTVNTADAAYTTSAASYDVYMNDGTDRALTINSVTGAQGDPKVISVTIPDPSFDGTSGIYDLKVQIEDTDGNTNSFTQDLNIVFSAETNLTKLIAVADDAYGDDAVTAETICAEATSITLEYATLYTIGDAETITLKRTRSSVTTTVTPTSANSTTNTVVVPIAQIQNGDIFYIELSGTGVCNTLTTGNYTVTVNPTPTAATITDDNTSGTLCFDGTVIFTADNSIDRTGFTYTWEYSTDGGTVYNTLSDIMGEVSGATTYQVTVDDIAANFGNPNNFRVRAIKTNTAVTPNCVVTSAASDLITINKELLVMSGSGLYSGSATPAKASNNAYTITAPSQGTATSYQWRVVPAGSTTALTTEVTLNSTTTGLTNNIYFNSTIALGTYYIQVAPVGDCNTAAFPGADEGYAVVVTPAPSSGLTFGDVKRGSIALSWTNGSYDGNVLIGLQSSTATDLDGAMDSDLISLIDGAVTESQVWGTASSINLTTAGISQTVKYLNDQIGTSEISANITGLATKTNYLFRLIDFTGTGAKSARSYYTGSNVTLLKKTSAKEGMEDEFSQPGTVNTISAISPNPAKDNITFNMDMAEEAYVTITIHSIEGNSVITFKNNEFFGAGKHLINIPLKDLAAGAYALSISYGNEAILQTFMVMP